jgi:hypothetical protein
MQHQLICPTLALKLSLSLVPEKTLLPFVKFKKNYISLSIAADHQDELNELLKWLKVFP